MQTAPSRVWTQVTSFISNDHDAMSANVSNLAYRQKMHYAHIQRRFSFQLNIQIISSLSQF